MTEEKPPCPDKRKDGKCLLNNSKCIKEQGYNCTFYEEYLQEVNADPKLKITLPTK